MPRHCGTCGEPEGSVYAKHCCTDDNMITDVVADTVVHASWCEDHNHEGGCGDDGYPTRDVRPPNPSYFGS